MADNNSIRKYYNDLARLFSGGPVVKHKIANKVAPPGHTGQPIGTARAFLKNSHNGYAKAVAAYGQYNRLARYSDYSEMETMAELNSALSIYSEECCVEDEFGDIIKVESPDVHIKRTLNELFYDTLNLQFNLPLWVRTACKYGDNFLMIDHHPDFGVLGVFPMPVNEVEREEGFDPENPLAYRYRWLTQGNRVLENWQVIHFRLMANDNFLPYGSSILEPARRVWRQLILMEDAVMVYRIVRSPERRVFYIDVGNVAPQEIPQFVEKAKTGLKRNQVVDSTTGRVDLRYNPMCKSLKTLIFLQDGRVKSLGNIIKERESGKKDQWVYSIDRENNKLVPGKIVWAGVTRKDAQLVRVHLDNGTYMDMTPDHKMMLRDKEYREAQHLKPGDALMPLYRKKAKFNSRGQAYWKTYDPFQEKYVFDHKTNAGFFFNEQRENKKELIGSNGNHYIVVHHKDFNGRNNNPENLEWMGNAEHSRMHGELAREIITKYNKSEKKRLKTIEDNKKYQKAQHMNEVYNGSELHKQHNVIRRAAQKKSWSKDREKRSKTMRWVIPDECFEIGRDIYRKNKTLNRDDFIEKFKSHKKIVAMLVKANSGFGRSIKKLSRLAIERRLKEIGYSGFVEYKKDALENVGYKNHKVVRVEWLDKREDTGCITVEKYHNFAAAGHEDCYIEDNISIDALTTGIFTKNSTDEDFFIPTRGEHSSRIETLPGGQFTGDIEDLQYIQNKLFAALKIPKSYLGYENDISSKSTLSQEDVRFAKTIQNIQRVFVAELNKLAVIHLYSIGIPKDELTNFTLSMANPSTISELQRLELWRTKFEVASMVQEGAVDRNFVYRKLFKLSDADIEQIEEGKRRDRMFDMEIEGMQAPEQELPPEMAAAPEEAPPAEEPAAEPAAPPPGGLPPPPGEEAGTVTAGRDPNAQRAAPNELLKVGKIKKGDNKLPNLYKHAFNIKKTAMDDKRNRSELTRLVKNPFGESVEDPEEAVFRSRVNQLNKFVEDLEKSESFGGAGKKNTKKVLSD